MSKITRYFENYQDAYNYYGGTNVPSKEIALVGDASYVFVSSDNAGDGGNTQYFDAAMTNDEIVATQVDAAYVSGTTQGYEQGYSEGYPLGYTAGHTAGYTEGETAGYDAGHSAGYAEGEAAGYTTGHSAGYAEGEAAGYADGEADYIAGMIENGTMAITTTSQVDVMEYAYAQVSDANLTAGNIADGVTILGVTGTYSGGITPTGTAYLQLNTLTDVSAYEFAYCEDTNGSYTAGYTGGTSYGYDWGYNEGLYAAPVNDKSLTFTASAANATVALNKVGSPNDITLSYSTDGGYTWAPYTVGTTITLANIGDTVKFKGTNATFSTGDSNYYNFAVSGVENVSGHVTSLLNGVGGDVTMTESCFTSLFRDCSSIKTAPELPSSIMAQSCYSAMFMGCSSLTQAPKLPATTLAGRCYRKMFQGCSALTTAPMLPATSSTNYGVYEDMFRQSGVVYVPYVARSFDFTNNTLPATIIYRTGTTVTWASAGTSKFYEYNPANQNTLWDDDPDVFMANVIAYYALKG